MKAAFFRQNGGPEVLEFGEYPDPVLKPGEVLVDVHAASVNGADWRVVAGSYGPAAFLPYSPGRDFSGVVSALGDGVTDFKVGDEVYYTPQTFSGDGSYAEYHVADESIVALRRAVELSGGETSANSDLANVLERRKRLDESEAVIAASLARKRTGRLLAQDVFTKNRWRADLAAARTALESWPGWLLQEDRGLFIAWQTFFWSRQPEKALALVSRMPREFLHDREMITPRAPTPTPERKPAWRAARLASARSAVPGYATIR